MTIHGIKARGAGVTTRDAESGNAGYAMGGAWIAAMSLWRQVERWDNEGGGQGVRPDFGRSGADLEVAKNHRSKRPQLLMGYAKAGEVGSR